MCGRFVFDAKPEEVATIFEATADDLSDMPQFARPRYNICPTQTVLTIRSEEDERSAVPMRWGFLPHWYETPTAGPLIINARSETIAEKPAFRAACRERRCLIPATGFYEWRSSDPKPKTPFYFHAPDQPVFAFAGIWQHWSAPGHEPVDTCAIVTCDANATMRPIHHRLPVVIQPESWSLWLGEAGKGAARLMHAAPDDFFAMHEVSRSVNSARSDAPSLIEPVGRNDPSL